MSIHEKIATTSQDELAAMWSQHNVEWRDPAQVVVQWQEASDTDPRLLTQEVRGRWWETLAETGITLLVTREYEHLAMALHVGHGGPRTSYMRLPHPSGLVVDRERNMVHIASTRNPNQVFDLEPATGLMCRADVDPASLNGLTRTLIPTRSRFYPGCLYMHDLALIDGKLYANSVGQNAIVRLGADGSAERVWWPKCIEAELGPAFDRNYIQLNSIAAGDTLEDSYFSASAEKLSARRPGHKNFPVDKRGVIFSGNTREAVVRGLTRPHSARLHNGRVWVDNSGYGELGFSEDGAYEPVVRMPGWTRGLCFCGDIAFVGTSRVIPRFRQYAPGLDVDSSVCGIHAVDMTKGTILGSIIWPYGNQIFAIDWLPGSSSPGFPLLAGARRSLKRETTLFYAYKTEVNK